MNILLIFSSTEGHTGRIARFLADELSSSHYTFRLEKAGPKAPSPAEFDAAIIAASIHAGQYANDVLDYATTYASELNRIPTMFYSIGLNITSKDPKVQESLRQITALFLDTTRWRPGNVEQVAGALLYTQYGFFKRMLIKSIMKKAGGDTDTKRDFVYTDWEQLRASLHRFTSQFEMMEH